MIEMTAQDIATAVGGRLYGVPEPSDVVVRHADTDSRAMSAGSLFIARTGEQTDGHLFIGDALTAGAALVLAQKETSRSDGSPAPSVIVADTTQAMGALASEIVTRIRAHSPTTVIGITGSAGKTTVKDQVATLLRALGPTVFPQGSYNGEVGVPLTVFTAALDTQYLVIEMGADAPGNIAELAEMVQPDIGVVLMVGSAHAGSLGGAAGVADVKGELVEAISPQGLVILNRDDPQVAAMAARAQAPVRWFSSAPDDETLDDAQSVAETLQARNSSLDGEGRPRFDMQWQGQSATVVSGLIGFHHIANVLAAASVALACGMSLSQISDTLTGLGAQSRWRMQRDERADGVSIINDAYNANPESMREALRTLAGLSKDSRRRSVAVLGAMLELGESSVSHHNRIGETVVRLNIDRTLVVGDEAYALYLGAIAEGSWGNEVTWVETLAEAEQWLSEELISGDIVLIKSSNGAGLGHLGERLVTHGGSV